MQIKTQKEFPLLERYKKVFEITDDTIFAYNNAIYTNFDLPEDILVHEETHLKQQNKIGADVWTDKYLEDKKFRLRQEVEAFRKQLKYYKDRNEINLCRIKCVQALSSDMYGKIVTPLEAYKLLK